MSDAPATGMEDRNAIRRRMRQRRRQLTPRERKEAARAVCSHLQSLVRLRTGMHLAIYLAVGGELDTRPIIDLARRRGCRLYVPIVHRDAHRLQFVPLQPPLHRNRFGIPEPLFSPQKTLDPRRLDIVLMPLVAFGPQGERLGSGAGFYDLTFAFLRRRHVWRKPRLIGLAYHWQQLPRLQSEIWDVPMRAVATDRAALRFR